MLVGQILQRVDVPHEDGQWMEFRKLPWRKLEEARRTTHIDGAGVAKAYGAEIIREMQRLAREGLDQGLQAAVAAERASRSQQYDTGVLLRAGIVKWSYSEGKPTPDEIDDLDEPTALWAREQILALSVPTRTEEERKNV